MSVPITVTILDENDNDPQFSRSSYQIYVTENSNSLASVNIIRVTDIDEGVNAELELTSNYFQITPENDAADEFRVELTSAIKLPSDAECNGIEVIVDDKFIASDNGSPSSRTNTANVRVIIADANDHTPRYTFDQDPSKLSVKERSLKGTVIADWDYQDDDPRQLRIQISRRRSWSHSHVDDVCHQEGICIHLSPTTKLIWLFKLQFTVVSLLLKIENL